MELTVARVGKAHGLRGEVALDLRTDDPEERLAVGERLETRPADAGPLTVATVRVHQGRWLVGFEGVRDRTGAEALRGVEHGTGIHPDLMYEISERGVAVTPTLLQIGQFENIARQADARYPVFAARMRRLHERRYEQARALYESGIQILVGTDAGGTIGHGRLADECAELVAAGIPDAAVVAAASWQGREYLGYTSLVEGASADFVVYPQDPRKDVGVLRAPTAVVLRGEIVAPAA